MLNLKNPYILTFWSGIAACLLSIVGAFALTGWLLLVPAAFFAWMLLGGGTDWIARNSVEWDFAQETTKTDAPSMESSTVWTTPETDTATDETPTTTGS